MYWPCGQKVQADIQYTVGIGVQFDISAHFSTRYCYLRQDCPQVGLLVQCTTNIHKLIILVLSSSWDNLRCSMTLLSAYYWPRNTFGSVHVCPFVCLWVLFCLNRLTFDLDFWHEGRPWPWLAWDCMSKVKVKEWKIALPFEPVVRSRSILGLGLPSSVNSNCEWPLPVHWKCLSVIRGCSTCRA